MAEIKLSQFPAGGQVTGEDIIPISQNGVTGTAKVKDIRNIGQTIDEGGSDKTASNENLKTVNKKVDDLATHVDDSFKTVNDNFTNVENSINGYATQLSEKIELHIGETLPTTREKNTLYFKITDTISRTTDEVKVSPKMGIKIV